MADVYKYTKINETSKQCAMDELKENPQQVNELIDDLRKWVKSMPHLRCPTVTKFDLKRAQQKLDNFCTIRSSPRGCPEYFNYSIVDERLIEEVLNSQIGTTLGRNDKGELIVLIILKHWDPDRFPKDKWATLMFMGNDIKLTDEETQIHGVNLIFDMNDAPTKVWEIFQDEKFLMECARFFQEANPWRLKNLVYLEKNGMFDLFFEKWMALMNMKYATRSWHSKGDLQEVANRITGLMDLLPTEYGGNGGPLKSIIDKWKEEFKAYYKNGYPWREIWVDESKRPEETLHYLTEYPINQE